MSGGRQANFYGMIGSSAVMKEVYARIQQAAISDARILFYGESGTGKELAAHATHRISKRKDMPFVGISLATIPQDLLIGELCGTKRGAYTGVVPKNGFFSITKEGTIFLDEINHFPIAQQSKMLRTLQENKFYPLGGREAIDQKARILSGSSKPLRELVDKGEFDEALYYRLKVVQITLPPLRDRYGDIAEIVEHYGSKFAFENWKAVSFGEDAIRHLEALPWYGNVRELVGVIEAAIALKDAQALPEEFKVVDIKDRLAALESTQTDQITPNDLEKVLEPRFYDSRESQKADNSSTSYFGTMEEIEQKVISARIRELGSVEKAADSLEINRRTVERKLGKWGIDPKTLFT